MTLMRDCEGLHRRDILKVGAAGVLGLSLADVMRLEANQPANNRPRQRARGVILVWLGGGPSTIDMWDLKPDAPTTIRGDFRPIDTRAPGIQICEHLPRVASVMDKGAIVRSLAHTIPDHGRATNWMMTGNKPTPAVQYPSLGSLAARVLSPEPGVPPYVTFGRQGAGNAGYLGAAYNPFEVEGNPGAGQRGGVGGQLRVRGVSLPNGFSVDDLENRNRLRAEIDEEFRSLDTSDAAAGLDRFQQQALDILRDNRTQRAFELDREPQALRTRYGADNFGQAALIARRLIEAGVRFVTITLGGWDTHGQNFTALRTRLLPQVDRTLGALVDDLAEKRLLQNTIVYCAGEFNRTPVINRNAGRDHWARSMAVFLAGGGIRAGYAHGTTDSRGMAPANEPCTPDDVAATIFHCLGIDGYHELMTASGRPMNLFREGRVISRLVA
ncbi:MAG: DUF1501 domain-containing protein [Planctomycetes bacterium]|nr:DUF1501 domain-containing protein [Planctomycetota bacterium]